MEKCRRSRPFGDWHLAKIGFWDMAIFVIFLDAEVANLGPIVFQLSLPLNINGNDEQNKF